MGSAPFRSTGLALVESRTLSPHLAARPQVVDRAPEELLERTGLEAVAIPAVLLASEHPTPAPSGRLRGVRGDGESSPPHGAAQGREFPVRTSDAS